MKAEGTEFHLNNNRGWFALTLLYLVFDYGRPQVVIPAIGHIRPMLIINLLLIMFVAKQGLGFKLHIRQVNLMWFFLCLLACYIPFARNNFLAYQTALSVGMYLPFVLSLIFCVDSFSRLKKVVFFFICLMIYVAAYSLFHNGRGPGNYFADENDLCLYVNMWLPFCYFLFFAERQFNKRLIYFSGLVVGLLAIVGSFSRGGFVGLVVMGGAAWWFSKKKILTLMILLTVLVLMSVFVGQEYKKEMATVTDSNQSTASERINSWKSAWDMFLDNPLGVGGNNFQVRFGEYQGERFGHGMYGRVAHSLWFTLIPELGIVGIYLYFSLLLANLKDILWLKKHQADEVDGIEQGRYFHFLGIAFIVSIVGFFASATFLSVLYYAHYWYLTSLVVAAVVVAKRIPETAGKDVTQVSDLS